MVSHGSDPSRWSPKLQSGSWTKGEKKDKEPDEEGRPGVNVTGDV